jgi:hypothetical protein
VDPQYAYARYLRYQDMGTEIAALQQGYWNLALKYRRC